MASEWATGLTRWQPYYGADGKVYSLAHLHPKRRELNFPERAGDPARVIEIQIGYSSHAFTRQCQHGEEWHQAYSRQRDPRVFCPQRYQLSLQLPSIVEGFESRRCYATQHENYFVVDTLDILPPNTEYWIFFNTRKQEPSAIRLFIESAYAGNVGKAPHGRKKESIQFKALVSKTLGLSRSQAPKKQTPS